MATRLSVCRCPHYVVASSLTRSQYRSFFLGSSNTKYEKSGRGIEIKENDFVLNEAYSPQYRPGKDVIIRNYSSCITPHNTGRLLLPLKQLTQKVLFYTNFCGVIEYLPPRYQKRSPYKVGDRVWGIKQHYRQPLESDEPTRIPFASLLGWKWRPGAHENAWSDYVCTDIQRIAPLPTNIPLEFGGLFPSDLSLIFDGFGRGNWLRTKSKIQGKRVLIIGSGRQSLLNILIPLLQVCNVQEIVIVSNHERHNKVLAQFGAKAIIEHRYFAPESHQGRYDLIVDSLSIEPQQILNNVTLIDPDAYRTEYWVLRNPSNQILHNVSTRREAVKEAFVWRKAVLNAGSKMDRTEVTMKPLRMVHTSGAFKAFSYWLVKFGAELEEKARNKKYPIVVDRLYKLDDIAHAVNYCLDHDIEDEDYMLGEHIGLSINAVGENEMIQSTESGKKIKAWKPMQLMDVSKYTEQKTYVPHLTSKKFNTTSDLDPSHRNMTEKIDSE